MAFSDSSPTPEETSSKKPQEATGSQRHFILKEILDTERVYVEDLRCTVEFFLKPLQEAKTLDQPQINTIFSHIEVILRINSQLLEDLEKRLKESSSLGDAIVGDVFQQMASYLKMYSSYCANHPTAMATLEQCMKLKPLALFLQKQLLDPRTKEQSLHSFLIKPIQRICKYPLFFRSLISQTAKDHPDYQQLSTASGKIEEVVLYINEAKRLAEQLSKIYELQSSISGIKDLVAPSRRFLKEAPATLIAPNRELAVLVFLFNDLIILAQPRCYGPKTKLRLKSAIPLAESKLIVHADSETYKNTFELIYEEESSILQMMDDKEFLSWLAPLKAIMKYYQKQRLKEQYFSTTTAFSKKDRQNKTMHRFRALTQEKFKSIKTIRTYGTLPPVHENGGQSQLKKSQENSSTVEFSDIPPNPEAKPHLHKTSPSLIKSLHNLLPSTPNLPTMKSSHLDHNIPHSTSTPQLVQKERPIPPRRGPSQSMNSPNLSSNPSAYSRSLEEIQNQHHLVIASNNNQPIPAALLRSGVSLIRYPIPPEGIKLNKPRTVDNSPLPTTIHKTGSDSVISSSGRSNVENDKRPSPPERPKPKYSKTPPPPKSFV
eukprot:TRINITY_DN12299_c0_g1_i1.p1 TRINITY_DN12299_c0_g1~~TRINITY_DN12299_c0_g1_i1.p1  ORF type:complete len:693 (+),score=130.01 TRINITY_DN12299_c0_g1_i1:279-2081(+)